MSTPLIRTTGDVALDRELFDLRRLVDGLTKRIAVLEGNGVSAAPQQVVASSPGVLTVQESDGNPTVSTGVLEVDQTTGLNVTQNGTNAKVSRTAGTTTPAEVAATGAAGTSIKAANEDHAHKGCHSVKSDGGAALYGDVVIKANGGCTITQSGQNILIAVP